MLSIVSFLIVIGICVISHEGGHFLAAKLRHVLVHEFSFGMGPELLSTKRGETQYSIRAFPIGGFVKLEGEYANDETEEAHCDPSRSLLSKKPWERAFIIAAGASVNILLAWLITALYLAGCGVYNIETSTIGNIMDGSPAYIAGLKSGDVIKSIDGNELKSWSDIRKNILNKNKKNDLFEIVIERDGQEKNYSINIPENADTGARLLGVQPPLERFPPLKALLRSFRYSWDMSIEILRGLYMTITGRMKADVTGPVGIASMAGSAFREGFWSFIAFLGIVNLNLGLLNLLPFPALDGGRLIFILIEVITRRKVPERVETMIHYAGYIVLLVIIALVTGKDIYRLMH